MQTNFLSHTKPPSQKTKTFLTFHLHTQTSWVLQRTFSTQQLYNSYKCVCIFQIFSIQNLINFPLIFFALIELFFNGTIHIKILRNSIIAEKNFPFIAPTHYFLLLSMYLFSYIYRKMYTYISPILIYVSMCYICINIYTLIYTFIHIFSIFRFFFTFHLFT